MIHVPDIIGIGTPLFVFLILEKFENHSRRGVLTVEEQFHDVIRDTRR